MLTRKYNTGFLLIELLMALFFLTTVTTVLAHYYWHIIACQRDVYRHQQALAVVNEFLETTAVSECSPAGTRSVDDITLHWKKKKNVTSGVMDHRIISASEYVLLEATATWHTTAGIPCTFTCVKGGWNAS